MGIGSNMFPSGLSQDDADRSSLGREPRSYPYGRRPDRDATRCGTAAKLVPTTRGTAEHESAGRGPAQKAFLRCGRWPRPRGRRLPPASREEVLRWFRRPEARLAGASVVLIASNLLLIVAVLVQAIGELPGRIGSVEVVRAALVIDLVGVALLAWALAGIGGPGADRRARLARTAAVLLGLWIAISVAWRYAVPAGASTDIGSLMYATLASGDPGCVGSRCTAILLVEGMWIVTSGLFVLAHVAVLGLRKAVGEGEWARDLPALAWLLSAGLSFGGTLASIVGLTAQMQGGDGQLLLPGIAIKLVIAPNLFVSAYVASLRLSLDVLREGTAGRSPTAAG